MWCSPSKTERSAAWITEYSGDLGDAVFRYRYHPSSSSISAIAVAIALFPVRTAIDVAINRDCARVLIVRGPEPRGYPQHDLACAQALSTVRRALRQSVSPHRRCWPSLAHASMKHLAGIGPRSSNRMVTGPWLALAAPAVVAFDLTDRRVDVEDETSLARPSARLAARSLRHLVELTT